MGGNQPTSNMIKISSFVGEVDEVEVQVDAMG